MRTVDAEKTRLFIGDMSNVIFEEDQKGVFRGWKVREGAPVREAAILLAYQCDGVQKQLKSPLAGVVESLANLKAGDELVYG